MEDIPTLLNNWGYALFGAMLYWIATMAYKTHKKEKQKQKSL